MAGISNTGQSSNLGHIGLDPVIDWLGAYINLYISTNDVIVGNIPRQWRGSER